MAKKDDIPQTPQMHNNIPAEDDDITLGEEESFSLSTFLANVHYPASKDDLMDYAADRGLSEEILDMIDQLPDTTYNSPTDVSQAMGENSEIG